MLTPLDPPNVPMTPENEYVYREFFKTLCRVLNEICYISTTDPGATLGPNRLWYTSVGPHLKVRSADNTSWTNIT